MANDLFNGPMLSAVIARAFDVLDRPPDVEGEPSASFKGNLQ